MFPWIAAVLLGALVPALIAASLSVDIGLLPLAFAITLGHAVILGLPVALFYRAKRWTRLSAVLAGAFLIGAIPLGILTSPLDSYLNGVAEAGGVRPAAGVAALFAALRPAVTFGLFGAVGGLVFWLTLRSCGPFRDAPETTPRQWRMGAALAGVAAIASLAVAAIPSITMDRSCHNMFSDGRRSVAPSLNVDLDIRMDDWSVLTTLLERFGASHGMSFRNENGSRPEVKILGLSACTEQGLVIAADGQRWAARGYAPDVAGRGVPVTVFDVNGGNSWQPLARELVAALESQWPGKVRFFGRDGRVISRSAASFD